MAGRDRPQGAGQLPTQSSRVVRGAGDRDKPFPGSSSRTNLCLPTWSFSFSHGEWQALVTEHSAHAAPRQSGDRPQLSALGWEGALPPQRLRWVRTQQKRPKARVIETECKEPSSFLFPSRLGLSCLSCTGEAWVTDLISWVAQTPDIQVPPT